MKRWIFRIQNRRLKCHSQREKIRMLGVTYTMAEPGPEKPGVSRKKSKQCLTGLKKNRRQVIYFSPEWEEDETLKSLRGEKYRDWVQGVSCSDKAVKELELSPEQFFEQEIAGRLERAQPGAIACFDDACDFPEGTQDLVRRLITKYMRVGRHRRVGICYCLHRLRHGQWSSQATSSCQNIVCFCRSNKHKIREYLNHEFGIPLAKARELVHKFAQAGRACYLRLHSPQMMLTEGLITLI